MTFNEGMWDRVIRILAGVALATAARLMWPGAASVLLAAVGAIALVTGLAGWCPAYALIGLSTRKRAGA